MSGVSTASGRLSPDDRYELAARAQNQQRLNYPRHLIVLGALLVFAACVALVIAWRVRSGAQSQSLRKANELAQIQQLVGEISALERIQASDAGQNRYEPIPDLLSTLSRFAKQSQFENDLGLPVQPKSRPEGNAIMKTYPYTISDPSLEHLLDWVKLSTEQIPGLEVQDLLLKPGRQGWVMTVTLIRYERNE